MNYGGLFLSFIRLIKFLITLFWTLFKPILMWTGLIWPGIVALLASFGFEMNLFIWIVAWAACAYTLAQSVMRLITKNPNFRLYYLITGAPAPATDEPIDVDVIE